MTRVRYRLAMLSPALLVPAIFLAVLRSGDPAPLARSSLPRERATPSRCNWSCHNHGCPHKPVLPVALSGDSGLFGATVRALHAAGDRIAPDAPGIGYGIVNLIVFCLAWPAAMWALWIVFWRQRRQIAALRRST
jgi:hypothetical protein